MKTRLVFLFLSAVAAASAQLYPTKLAMIQSASFSMGETRIQFELKLSEDQVKSVTGILSEHATSQQGISDQLAKAKADQFAAIQAQMDKLDLTTSDKLIAALTLPQKTRLKQIAYQENGAFALRNAGVSKDVGLSADQRAKIEAICQSTTKSLDDVSGKMADEIQKVPAGKGGDSKRNAIVKRYDPQLNKMEANAKSSILAVLTPAQRKKWQTMLGKPFKI